jgi:asparagine synthase (glutamine-hydrolysing)
MVSDVPIGSFLSGGIDSSLVARAAAMTSDRPLRTFTIDFCDERFSEKRFAAAVAEKINSDATFRCVQPGQISELPELVEYYDEPFADSSMLPTFVVSRITREHTTVALSGDGGDELFTGYTHHAVAHQTSKLDMLPDWLNALAFQWATRLFPSTVRLHQWGRRLAFPYEIRRLTSARLPGRAHRLGVLSADYRETTEARFWHVDEWLPKLHGLPPVTQVQIYDLAFYLPNDMLVKVDRASMAHSLEARVPFLSRRVAELAFRIPEEVRFRPGQDKRVLRRLVQRHFGDDLAYRQKMGFGVPLQAWMQIAARDRREELLSAQVMKSGLLDTGGVCQLLDDVGNDYSAWRVDRSEELFALLVFNTWWERYCN